MQAEKRIWGKLATARAKAPTAAKRKWDEICARKGTRGGNITSLKKDFLMAWVSDPEWQDAYFAQSLTFSEKTLKKTTGTWITVGRLQQLIGAEETATALVDRADTVRVSICVYVNEFCVNISRWLILNICWHNTTKSF